MKLKLLAPAGNFEALKVAVFAGADEVYLGVNQFNARNNVDSFTIETLKEAVDFAHLYNVKVSLAVNILFTDDELPSAVKLCVDATNLGVDHIIICDLGLAKILSTEYPEIQLHASTQMGIHNLEGVLELQKFNFKRVVLARETTLAEIKRIKQNCNIEIEYFAHGALCVSFSGNCYLSAKMFDASGNRGKCKQLCRLPYKLTFNNKTLKSGYLLSAKDFNMLNKLKDLENAGVDVLKIEGRARRAYYVYAITKTYRNAIDNKPFSQTEIDLAFNRGFCEGYFNGNGNVISNKQNHQGINIGKIVKVVSGKKFNEVYITTTYPISAKSTLKLFDGDNEIQTVSVFDITKTKNGYKFTTTASLKNGYNVNLISDYQLEQNASEQTKKVACKITINAFKDKPIRATFTNSQTTFNYEGNVLSPAKNQPLDLKEVVSNFNKTEYFSPDVQFNTDGVFVPKQELNAFRRKVYEIAKEQIVAPYYKNIIYKEVKSSTSAVPFGDFEIIAYPTKQFSAKNVIYSPEEYSFDKVIKVKKACDKVGANLYLDTPNFATKKDVEILRDIIQKTKVKIVANNLYALSLSTDYIVGAGLNIFNNESASVFNKPLLTCESDKGKKIDFPLMTFRHCPFKNHLNSKCENCNYKPNYQLELESGKKFTLSRKKLSTCTFYLSE